ncbi:hypothetical protein [Streptomyces pactum]|uniref:hypothetical protein n=1 Tax=Streptomyces pactum TaxID=68249 RepID=UPI001E3A753C|nr:hypothetical protein [Streptomyces pactum]
MLALAAVRDLREFRDPVSAEEREQFETDVLAGFVLARASAGLADGTICGDVGHLDQMRAWFGRPLWDTEPADADGYLGKVLRGSPSGTRPARAQSLTTYFLFLELPTHVRQQGLCALPRRIRQLPRPATRSMIRVLVLGLPRGGRHETAQPVGGRQPQAPAQRVDPDHRPVDSRLSKTAQPRTHLRLVPCLKDHFPLSRVRRGVSSKPLPHVLLPPPSLPLSWHLPRITGRCQDGKASGPSTHTLGGRMSDRPQFLNRGREWGARARRG